MSPLLSSVPSQLWPFFSSFSTLYYIISSLLLLSPLSPFTPLPILLPLIVLALRSTLRGLWRELSLIIKARREERQKCKIIQNNRVLVRRWGDLKQGDALLLTRGDDVPADCFVLGTGKATVEMDRLDGEKGAKVREGVREVEEIQHEELGDGEMWELNLGFELYVQNPAPELYKFDAYIKIPTKDKQHKVIPLSAKNLICKGSTIRDAGTIVGIVVYTGIDTKIQMNISKHRPKTSKLERRMNVMMFWVFIGQLLFSFLSSFGQSIVAVLMDTGYKRFLELNKYDSDTATIISTAIRYFILLSSLIPISLVINLEFVRIIQSWFLRNNVNLKCHTRDL